MNHLNNDSIQDTPLQLNLGRWKKALCPKIVDNNGVLTDERLILLNYAWLSCMYVKDSSNFILEARIQRERSSSHMMLKNAWHQQILIMTSLLCMQQLIEQYLHSAVSYHAKYVLLALFPKP